MIDIVDLTKRFYFFSSLLRSQNTVWKCCQLTKNNLAKVQWSESKHGQNSRWFGGLNICQDQHSWSKSQIAHPENEQEFGQFWRFKIHRNLHLEPKNLVEMVYQFWKGLWNSKVDFQTVWHCESIDLQISCLIMWKFGIDIIILPLQKSNKLHSW